ncbi:NADH-quinone oxidoreductase subunit J [Desulfuromonas versatilis]|uniref:NADH-quinone oxidoreductase subunit J n=1 Tax=Desulfuromonas versatilis TaxID=2802975 RepID=A0ABM8HY04_9BACT|nr:NADH-quinone oxidoreductase subunit J [Desulfuromonas versatilis]BCR05687.1 NADH-quinone oxidoreductase subunit J [Desulfuromonas versatilis]
MSGILIGFFSLLAVLFAVLVILLRQPMRAALALVSLMISLAAIYACLGAHVVAVFQVLIYVGAVMVFMVYTIMLLDERDSSFRHPYSRLAAPALATAALVAAAFWKLLGTLPAVPQGAAVADPFTFASFSLAFMKHYWFHFELATVLLLVGILAAWTALKEGRDG